MLFSGPLTNFKGSAYGMKWKEVLLGAVASLAVTVIGGIAVYYLTKEPDYIKSERLVYSVQQTASFEGGTQNIAVTALTLKNLGGIASKNVSLLVTLKAAEIRDVALASSSSLRESRRKVMPHKAEFLFETLLPTESVTLSLLLSYPEAPSVVVRSEASLGIESPVLTKPERDESGLNRSLEYLVPASGALLGILFFLAARILRRGGYTSYLSSDRNNAGFLMLHHGFTDEASAILNASIHAGRYDPFTLSNYAVCKALNNDIDGAQRLMRAAEFFKTGGHGKAVILFNKAIISLVMNQKDQTIKLLKEAIQESPKIRSYFRTSVQLDSIRNHPAFQDLVKQNGA